jgi:PAS domain S-box-containing protein
MGTFTWDLRTQEFQYSPRLAEIFGGAQRADFGHRDLVNLIHPDDLHLRHEAVRNSYELGSLNYRVRLIWPDKSLHWVSVYGKIIYDEHRLPVTMYGTALDISRERQYQRDLEESEEKFRSLANFLPTFIWTTDPEGKITYLNKAISEFTGMTENEIVNGGWLNLIHPGDRAVSIRELERAIHSGTDFSAEMRFKNSQGQFRWQLGRVVAIKDADGQIKMWIGTSIDIHNQKMMAEELEKRVALRTAELKEANEQLITSNQELEQFAFVSSHDLQEPLRKIQTFSDMVLRHIEPEEKTIRMHIEKINSSANRMSVLITDLLNYSRVGKSDEQFVPVDLNKVLENILNDFEVLIKQKQAVINPGYLPVVPGIPIQLNQLFYNLISNALKFSVAQPLIQISADQLEGSAMPADVPLPANKKYVRLIFKDNGIGFEQIYASQIFTIFQRLNNRTQYSGTGIGLAVCKKIAENHQGYISARSAINEGAEFIVYLPAAAIES